MAEIYKIEIINWEKYQGNGKRYSSTSWFKLQNNMYENKLWDYLSPSELKIFLYTLMHTSRIAHDTGVITTSYPTLSRLSTVKIRFIKSAFSKLEELEVVKVSLHRAFTVQSPCAHRAITAPEKRREDKRREEKIREESTELKPATRFSFDACCNEFQDPILLEFFHRAKIKTSSQALWVKTYGDEPWLKMEFLKIISWLDANPHKKPKKNYSRFVTNWLSRGWETHRKSLQSNKPVKSTLQELEEYEGKKECKSE